ncbi:MAG: hypothetical protein HZA52_19340 [Planctomycetes bacterium]|nr:hypothetical protein [Planctomycetota bacterium]
MRFTFLALAFTLASSCTTPTPVEASGRAPMLGGRIVDETGRGLAGITVMPHGGLATRWPCAPTRTDEDGRFELSLAECGAHVWHSDDTTAHLLVGLTFSDTTYACVDGQSWWDVEVPADGRARFEREFVFVPGGAIEGRVVDGKTGEPLALGMRLYTGTAGAAGFFRWFESESDGRFHEIGLAAGDYTLDGNLIDGGYPLLGRCKVEAGVTTKVELVFSARD